MVVLTVHFMPILVQEITSHLCSVSIQNLSGTQSRTRPVSEIYLLHVRASTLILAFRNRPTHYAQAHMLANKLNGSLAQRSCR